MAKDKNPHLALRVQVESGGCHGFQYLMSLTTLPPWGAASAHDTTSSPPSEAVEAEITPSTTTSAGPTSGEIGDEDTIFAFVKEEAHADTEEEAVLTAGPKVVIDAPSLELLKGSKVDFVMELIGSQFKIVDNPAAVSGCGCGTSFDIKI
jgi:iron-sulfur cluster assembly 2